MNPDRYFNSQWNYQADIVNYLERLKTQGCANKTIYSKVGAIRSFLVENEVELSRKFWKRLGLCNDPTIRDKIPTPQELQSILTHTDCRGRSLYLLLTGSGIRIGNALNQFLEIFHH
jgi:hypothetical protein